MTPGTRAVKVMVGEVEPLAGASSRTGGKYRSTTLFVPDLRVAYTWLCPSVAAVLSHSRPGLVAERPDHLVECRRIEREPARRRDDQVDKPLLIIQARSVLAQVNHLEGTHHVGRNRRGRHGIRRRNQAGNRHGRRCPGCPGLDKSIVTVKTTPFAKRNQAARRASQRKRTARGRQVASDLGVQV